SPTIPFTIPVFQFVQPEKSQEGKIPNERIDRSHLAIATIGRRWRNGHSVASRTWCLDRHGFGQCLGAVEVQARENPSWLAAMTTIAHAASGSRIYVSSCDLGTSFAKPVAIGRGPYTSRHDRYLRIAVALVSAANVRFSTTLHKYADWV